MPLQTNRLNLEDVGAATPNQLGQVLISQGSFQMRDGVGTYDPRTIWSPPHRDVPQLAHLLDGYAGAAPYRVITGQPFPSNISDYYDANLTKIACKIDLTRDTLQRVTLLSLSLYGTDGTTLLASATRSVTYTGLWVSQVITTRTA